MGEPLQLILLLIAVIAGAISVFLSFRLMKRYPLPHVNSYFYYLVFLFIFGVYGLTGSGILGFTLTRMGIEERTIQSARLIAVFLGIPFLVLSKYMLLRSFLEYFRKKIPSLFTIPYFMAGMAALVLYGVFVIRFSRFNQGDVALLIKLQRWVFIGFLFLTYFAGWVLTQCLSNETTWLYEKRFIRNLGTTYLLYMAICCNMFLFLNRHPVFPVVFLFFFLGWHLIPILFLNLHLGKHHAPATSLYPDFESKLEAFSGKYDISNREREVVQLICKGYTNQEISESLFISLQTVKDHVHHIFVKTGVRNRVQLTNLIRSA
ncbi:MAG TPA: hypothetical protein ENO05_12840 [Bacteroides sp.]|nr:hypothetical protein [Bacteroides sp.]